ncbi:HAD family hydrolase [Bacillus salipaludis]|uniref:HAD family hydrolase n=1 Tax=Bacillus salipaludis TaxID=2547811 RepID=A0AA90QTZ7_9BACI|nr:HAD family hydrolase [Bacillus salipaludis]MDQ6594893.1 HAD family hydrolase [Bacillus salipaludis]
MEIKAVFFDLDDTLHDHQAPFAKALLDTIHHWPSMPDLNTAYKKFRYYSDYFWKDYTQGNISLEQLRINRIIATLENLGKGISEQEAVRFQENYENNLNTPILFTEVPSVFDALKRKGIEVGLITNGPITHQQNKISQLGLQDFINEELIFISDQVGFAKPNPQLFHTAAKKIDLPAEHLLYVGDTWENDVVGPISAGWNAIWFNHRSREPLTDHKPLAEINKLSSLLNLLNL